MAAQIVEQTRRPARTGRDIRDARDVEEAPRSVERPGDLRSGRRVGSGSEPPAIDPTAPDRPGTRRRPHVPARRRPPSGLVPAGATAAPTVTACPEASTEDGYRLGRWARLAITVAALATTVIAVLVLSAGPSMPSTTTQVRVEPGDTLWAIATANVPDADPRAVIDRIRELNGLAEGALPIGAVLVVPAG